MVQKNYVPTTVPIAAAENAWSAISGLHLKHRLITGQSVDPAQDVVRFVLPHREQIVQIATTGVIWSLQMEPQHAKSAAVIVSLAAEVQTTAHCARAIGTLTEVHVSNAIETV